MLIRWTDYDRDLNQTFSLMEEFQRRMDQLFSEFDTPRRVAVPRMSRTAWPPLNFYDAGDELVIQALVPGLSEQEINLKANQDVLTISGERKADAPANYSVHRQERGAMQFSRSFTLPCRCDLEKTSATVRNGVLTIKLAKAPEAKPRQITVSAQ